MLGNMYDPALDVVAGIRLINTTPATPVKGGDKFRATWTLSNFLPAFLFNAPRAADEMRNFLPTVGFIPVSNPSALPGDQTVSFDGRLAQSWGGRTVSDVVDALDIYPTLNITRLEFVPLTLSSDELEAHQDAAHAQAEQDAEDASLLDPITKPLGAALAEAKSSFWMILGAAALVSLAVIVVVVKRK